MALTATSLWRILKCGVATLLLFFCSAPLSMAFDDSSASYVLQPGDNSISGRAYLTSRSGYVRNCGYDSVHLIPVTPYSTQWMSQLFPGPAQEYAPDAEVGKMPRDEAFMRYQRIAACDGFGNFRFDHVADGKYFVFATVSWLSRWQRNGGGLMAQVEVMHASQQNVVLTKAL